MDKNAARGRAEKTVSSFITGLLGVNGMVDRLLIKRYGDENAAAIKQAIQDIANEHAQQAELHRAAEQGGDIQATNYMTNGLKLSIDNDDETSYSVTWHGLVGYSQVTLYCASADGACKLFEGVQDVIGVEAD